MFSFPATHYEVVNRIWRARDISKTGESKVRFALLVHDDHNQLNLRRRAGFSYLSTIYSMELT